jgi:hypothetical protein
LAPQIPPYEPSEVAIGDTIKFDITVPDYPPADGWTLTYAFRGPSDWETEEGDVVGVDSHFEVRIPKERTTRSPVLTPGPYQFYATVTDGTERYVVRQGTIVLTPDPTAAVNAQTHNQRTLAVIEAAIEGRLTADLEAYQISGRAVTKIPAKELVRLRGVYAYLVEVEKNPGAAPAQHRVRFSRG